LIPGLLARRPDGIFLADFEQGEIGPVFVQAAWVVLIKPKIWERHGLRSWIEAARKRLHPASAPKVASTRTSCTSAQMSRFHAACRTGDPKECLILELNQAVCSEPRRSIVIARICVTSIARSSVSAKLNFNSGIQGTIDAGSKGTDETSCAGTR
jgi:hypothetical protein